jgi:hypothetical protein
MLIGIPLQSLDPTWGGIGVDTHDLVLEEAARVRPAAL